MMASMIFWAWVSLSRMTRPVSAVCAGTVATDPASMAPTSSNPIDVLVVAVMSLL